MRLTLLRPDEIPRLRRACASAARTLQAAGAAVAPGVSTAEIDALVREHTRAEGGRPSQLGYRGDGPRPFPAAVCTSVNDVVCHGVPRADVVLRDGDIVNIDVTTELDGFHGDCSATFVVGSPSPLARHLVEAARRARDAGIAAAKPGGRLGDIGAAVLAVAQAAGCSVVREFGGHGIGRAMHLEPHVSHVALAGTGPRLRPGLAFTVEPMLCLGSARWRLDDDGWTVRTVDGGLSAQWEHTVLVTEAGVEVLTG